MKILVADDDFTSRVILQEMLKSYGAAHLVTDGSKAVSAFSAALEADDPYELICLDALMPELDGHQVLQRVRLMEMARGRSGTDRARIIIVSGCNESDNNFDGLEDLYDGILTKPIERAALNSMLDKLNFVC